MYPREYLDYLLYFHAERDYFECHEILEEYWKKDNQQNPVWVGLIQIAVALYHQRRQNYRGAVKMMASAIHILQEQEESLLRLGIDHAKLLSLLQERLQNMQQHAPYQLLQLPLHQEVLDLCYSLCQERGLVWGKESDLNNEELVHKHTLRDRSDVIHERLQKLRQKRNTTQ